jgi:hypothetical protein
MIASIIAPGYSTVFFRWRRISQASDRIGMMKANAQIILDLGAGKWRELF